MHLTVCVSQVVHQVYHVIEDAEPIKAVPFIPRFDDALVAELIEDEAFTLEGHMRIFGGLHMGYDRPPQLSACDATVNHH